MSKTFVTQVPSGCRFVVETAPSGSIVAISGDLSDREIAEAFLAGQTADDFDVDYGDVRGELGQDYIDLEESDLERIAAAHQEEVANA